MKKTELCKKDFKNIFNGEEIKKLRKEQGKTQQQLADEIGKTVSSVRKYEKGLVNIPLEALIKIAYALGADVSCFCIPDNYNLPQTEIQNNEEPQDCKEEVKRFLLKQIKLLSEKSSSENCTINDLYAISETMGVLGKIVLESI